MNVIYCTIRDYSEQARLLVRSLRLAGAFDGKIVIFTPKVDDFLHDLSSNKLADVELVHWDHHPRLDRIAALAHPAVQTQGAILGLDADILAMRPVEPLFDLSFGIRYQEEHWQRLRDLAPGHPTDMYLTNMDTHTRSRLGHHHPINIGHYLVAGGLAERLYKAWWPIALAGSGPHRDIHGADQAAFNFIIRCGPFPSAPWAIGEVMNASKHAEADWHTCRLLHFAGTPRRWEHMRRLSGYPEDGVPRMLWIK